MDRKECSMFSSFLGAFDQTSSTQPVDAPGLADKIEPFAPGFTELMSRFAGATFRNGLYRLHTLPGVLPWTAVAEEALTRYKGRIVCFGFDWLQCW